MTDLELGLLYDAAIAEALKKMTGSSWVTKDWYIQNCSPSEVIELFNMAIDIASVMEKNCNYVRGAKSCQTV